MIINEFSATPSEQQLSWGTNGVPRMGSGTSWMEPDFIPRGWSRGNLPAGYGFAGLGTDLTTTMKGKTPTLYLRKEFSLTSTQAAFAEPLQMVVDYDDGFVAYLNGREIARVNAGASNAFIYAGQPAYNVVSTPPPLLLNLGSTRSLVSTGRNVLAIQALNAESPSTVSQPERITLHQPTPEFKIDAGLRVSGATVISARPATFKFDDVTGASRTHLNTNGVATDSRTGTVAPNGWLARAADPTSSANWQGLQIVSEELPGGGAGGSGGLRYTITQSGSNQPASVHAPTVDMAGSWEPGGVTPEHIANTILRFRLRTTPSTQYRLRIDPALGQEASALSGFPIISGNNEGTITFSGASGGARLFTVNATGSQSQTSVGSLTSLLLFGMASNDARGLIFRLTEDATVGAGNLGSKGHLRAEITQAGTAGSTWGLNYGGMPVQLWTPGNISSEDLGYATFQFAYKIPVGVSFQVWVEPGSGSPTNRIDWGTITGDGTWQLAQRFFAGSPNSERFRGVMNAQNTRNVKLFFQGNVSLGVGTWLQLDDFQILPWRKYEVRLSDGTNGTSSFLSFANANSLSSFVPAFEKVSDASAVPQTLSLDDYEVLFVGTNAASITNLVFSGATGGAWDYFIGLAEPSGGLFDPGLLTNSFPIPAGEEGDFEQPANFVDWLELYNDGATPVDLSGWSLTDQKGSPGKWHFPTNTTIGPNSYLVVLCDDREEANAPAGPATYLHASFTLGSDGEFLGLFDNNGVFVDGLTSGYPKQVFFASYGRNPGNVAEFGFLANATPGVENRGPYFTGRVDAPDFKQPDGTNDFNGGIYIGPSITLLLTNHTAGSTIRYTLDGSEPTEINGTNYISPLSFTQPTDKTGIVVRARAFLPGWLPSGVKTHSYILRQALALTNAPVLMLTAPKDRAFYKPFGVLGINGGSFVATASGNIWVSDGPQAYDQVVGSGNPFEREVHMEYFFPSSYYPPGQTPIREDVGLRVSASPYQRPRMKLANVEINSPWTPSDQTEKPSFNIMFNGDYGISKLDYPLFRNYDIKEFQNLRLRAGKNDNVNPWMTDEFIRRMWGDMGHVSPHGLFCSLYVNAIYRGIYNLTERVREPLFQAHYHSSADWDVRYVNDWVNGDAIVFNTMMTALNRDLTTSTNYLAALNLLDVDNFADYYLLNIYCAMWDWPENNFVFARERSSGPLSKFRYTVWDAEGGFNVQSYYSKPVNFDTVNELNTKGVDVANIWKRLMLNPEFRLRFADRVNKHMFNNGVLDDRDPDSVGPLVSSFLRKFNEVAGEAAPLVQYNQNALQTNLFVNWSAAGTGRRSYLLGAGAGRQIFRDNGLWPLTEPPIFSQFGGSVPPDYGLTITNNIATAGQSATIYFTLDGNDPRVFGGTVDGGASIYTGVVPITNIVTVRARAKNDVTGEWSPLTEATFAPEALTASSNNIVIAELMYHPPDATTNEAAAGFINADDFEFIRIVNIGNKPVDLSGLRLTTGVIFDFNSGAVRYVRAGGSVLVVKNRAAFRARYGMSLEGRIAGEYTGNLSNSGERLALVNGTETVRDFAYADGGDWPESPDGDGPSLMLRDPFGNPEHAQATNWIACSIPGGLPGDVAPLMTFDSWRALLWGPSGLTNVAVSGASADSDGDGLINYAEFALGLHPKRVQSTKRPQTIIENIDGTNYLTMQFNVSSAAAGVSVTFQVSSNLLDWVEGPPGTELMSIVPNIDGTVTFKYRDTAPIEPETSHFMRLRISGP